MISKNPEKRSEASEYLDKYRGDYLEICQYRAVSIQKIIFYIFLLFVAFSEGCIYAVVSHIRTCIYRRAWKKNHPCIN